MAKCLPGCSCGRHSVRMPKCPPDCTCGRHSFTDERRKNIGEALQKRPPSEAKQAFLRKATEPRLCACGCGEYATVDKRRNRVSKYVSGHNARTAHPMKGKRHTEEAKRTIAERARQQAAEAFPERQAVRDNPGTYRTWHSMLWRIDDPKCASYPRYGGRGITICERWRTFENFLADMGPRPERRTLDRIDRDGNYEPGNCRWATKVEQEANKSNPWLDPEKRARIIEGRRRARESRQS